MGSKLLAMLVGLGAAAVIGGCGGSSVSISTPSTSSTTSASAPSSTQTSSVGGATTTTTAAGSSSSISVPDASTVIAACEAEFQNSPLPASVKTGLLAACKEAPTNPAAAKAKAKQVCLQLVNSEPASVKPIIQAVCARI
jgi:hypothetical protein